MHVARDSVGTALPFTAGIALSMWMMDFISHDGKGILASVFLVAACVTGTAAAAWTAGGNRHGTMPQFLRPSSATAAIRAVLAAMLFAAGMYISFTRSLQSSIESPDGPVTMAAMQCAEMLKDLIDGIPYSDRQTGALVKALLTGDRSGLDSATKEAFRLSGASHLLALSGMHLGIIYIMTSRLLTGLGHSRNASAIRAAIVIAFSGFFTLMTGASPSIVRAFLFIVLNETAALTGRLKNGVHTLCMALTIQLAIAPENISSIGFQLSYLAMAGIFILYPTLKKWFPEEKRHRSIMGRIWDAAALSISCQAFTAPAVLYHFGTFPQYFILTNLLAIPLTTMTMAISVATVTLSAIGICPDFLVTASETVIAALRFSLETISSL